VVGRTGLRLEQIELHLYAKETSSRHRGFMLDFYGFKPFRPHGRPILAEEIARLLRSQIKPKVIFWRCVDVLIREKIKVPGYFPLADQILSAINISGSRSPLWKRLNKAQTIGAVDNRWIPITPLRLDLTDEAALRAALESTAKEGDTAASRSG
jgi:Domain of unknown function (DUF4158)